MALFPNFRLGIKSYGEAHRFIVKNRLWGYVFFPGIINLLLLGLLAVGGGYAVQWFTRWLFDAVGLNAVSEGFWGYLVSVFRFLLRIVLYILLFFLYSSVYRYIILIFISPGLALMSEKTEKLVTGNEYPFVFSRFAGDVWRGIRIALRNSMIEIGLIILFFFIGFIPVIGYISPVFLFFVSCYFYGFSMMDYTHERAKMSIRQSVKFVRKNRGLAVANGMVFYFIFFFIPVLGFMVAPAYAVTAATLAILRLKQDSGGQKKEAAPVMLPPEGS